MKGRLKAGHALRYRAEQGSYLYDPHTQHFAPVGPADVVSGFHALYLAERFDQEVAHWESFVRAAQARVRELATVQDARALVSARDNAGKAAQIAALAYPDIERFVELGGPDGYRVREDWVFQPNVKLGAIQLKGADPWRDALPALKFPELPAALQELGLLEAERPVKVPEPGVYLIGHSGLLLQGRNAKVVVDPFLGRSVQDVSAADYCAGADGVLLTHSHFDHYQLGDLAMMAPGTIYVPKVTRATVACEDMHARLEDLGASVSTLEWGARIQVGDIEIECLPFRGEQCLASERWPDARNWGNTFVVTITGRRYFIAADSGFEPGRDVLADLAGHDADVIVCQTLGLPMTLGSGDADLRLGAFLCPERTEDFAALLHPSQRMTLSTSDLPTLVERVGASEVVLYGQFSHGLGTPSVSAPLAEKAREALSGSPATVHALRVGEGLGVRGPVKLST